MHFPTGGAATVSPSVTNAVMYPPLRGLELVRRTSDAAAERLRGPPVVRRRPEHPREDAVPRLLDAARFERLCAAGWRLQDLICGLLKELVAGQFAGCQRLE